MSSSGRTALVTGGNRGLGAAIARALDDAGHRVIITHTPGNEKVAAWLEAQGARGYRFTAYGVDVGDWESTQALAQEVARRGVTVNTVSPGYLATEMVMAVRDDVRQKIIDAIPVGRLGQPDEIAALVAFIASEAAAFMVGSNVAMNGGQHMY